MSLLSPQPRYRTYTSFRTYFSFFKDLVFCRLNKGRECEELENEICRRFNVANSVCLPQARVGIYLAVKAIIEPGQKIILSPYTIADVINMIICAGGIPVFTDIERKTCNIDPAEVEKLIDDKTGAVLVTHLHGLAAPMDRITEMCKKTNVSLIEDSAQAFGARFDGKWLGSFGDAGIFSFGRYKNLMSFYGGMVVTPCDDIHDKMHAEISSFPYMGVGQISKRVLGGLAKDIATSPPLFQVFVYRIFRFGYLHNIRFINRYVETELDLSRKDRIPENYFQRMTPMQARLVLSKIDRVEMDNTERIRYARTYHEGLSDLADLILPPLRKDGSHIYTYYPIQYRNRPALIRWIMEHRRDVGAQHLKNCADIPAFKHFFRDCPNARATADEVILLPTYPRYSEAEVNRNIKVIRMFFGK